MEANRRCLMCGEMFLSSGPGNRQCGRGTCGSRYRRESLQHNPSFEVRHTPTIYSSFKTHEELQEELDNDEEDRVQD